MKVTLYPSLAAGVVLLAPCILMAQTTGSPREKKPHLTGLEEIVVTARRVREPLQKVPVTVTAFDKKDLARIDALNSTDLSGFIPNTSISSTGAGTGAVQIFIRGIGQNALAFNLESPVATYIDDVYIGRIQGALLDLLDIQRIEVLRGPQGTLYGRNSTVGAIKYITQDPDLTTPHYGAATTFGSYNRKDVNLFGSAPIVKDELAIKFEVGSLNQDGYIKTYDASGQHVSNGDGERTLTGRVALLWEPTADWRVDLDFDATNNRSGSTQGTPIACTPSGSSCSYVLGSPYKAGQNGANDGYVETYGTSLRVSYDLYWATLKSITSYRVLRDFDAIDFTSLPGANSLLPDHKNQHQASDELQLISKKGQRITWIAGLFYYDENIRHSDNFVNAYLNSDHQISNSYAAYGDATYKIISGLNFEAGIRISQDSKSIARTIYSYPVVTTLYDGNGSFSTSAVTYKAGLNYAFTPEELAYLTYSTGYRPGSFGETYPGPAQIATNSVLTHLNNEVASNVEIGLKNEFFDHHWRLNVDGFYTHYSNLQTESSVSPYPVLSNNVQLEGVEVETEARPTDGLTLFGNASYLASDIQSGPGAGDTLQFAPKFKFAVGGDYRQPITDNITAFVGASMTYTSTFITDSAPVPPNVLVAVTQKSYSLVNAQIGAEFADGHYRLALSGKNLTNTAYFSSISPGTEQFYSPPRTILVSLSVRY
jgi:iron complex outermembrane receptor protein